MLSYYDTLSFSVRKSGFLAGFCISLLIIACLVLVGFSLESQYSLFSYTKGALQSTDNIVVDTYLYKLAETLNSPTFKFIVSRKLAMVCFLIIFLNLLFFSWQLILSKKELFQPTTPFTKSFFLFTLSKLMLLLSPFLIVAYMHLPSTFFALIDYAIRAFAFGEDIPFVFVFSPMNTIVLSVGLFVYSVYTITLFIGRFSFSSLLNLKLFFKHIKVVTEMIFQILTSIIFAVAIFVAIGVASVILDPIYLAFLGLLIYFMCVIGSSSRWVFMTFFMVVGGVGFGLSTYFGYNFFKTIMILYVVITLLYFSSFFIFGAFFSALAYSFTSTSYVFRFDQTPSKDIKKQAPEKLRRIDEIYNSYLKEHKNDTQDNFFHHLEE